MKMRTVKLAEKRKQERGSVLATSAIAMLSVLLAVGLGLDISRMYLSKAELQNAADASALAGASGLNGGPAGITEAANRAVQSMNKYDFNKTGVTFPRSSVEFAVNLGGPYVSEGAAAGMATNIRFVRVTTPSSPVGISFAAIVLGSSRDLSATATAGFSVPLNVICPWLPAFVLDNPNDPIKPGGTYTFRLEGGNAISPGNYQLLAPIQSGGSGVREGMANGVNWCISVGTEVPTKPGVSAGPVRQGINTRFDDFAGGLDPAVSPPDTNIAENITYAQYRDNAVTKAPKHIGVADRRVVFIPIAAGLPGNGRDSIVVARFGVFFLQTSVGGGNGGELKAEYITDTAFAGNSSFDPGAGASNDNLAVPVLYK
ncbi:MAG TPA: pilus assembly protein TadG-related protein [Pyrinomonadaceae bacterium]|nr:pilus assembly protein TadG-related protein [Pyrinomonadaceae bacterium]